MFQNPNVYTINIEIIENKLKNVDVRIDKNNCEDLTLIFDLKASLISAKATIISALERNESRGAHQRSDFKTTNHSFKFNYDLLFSS